MANAKETIATWEVVLLDLNDDVFRLVFEIVDVAEPFVVGWNILKYSNHVQLSRTPSLTTKTPRIEWHVEFASYSNPDEDHSRIFAVPPDTNNKSSMIRAASRDRSAVKAADLLVRKIHAYSHGSVRDMKLLLRLSNKLNPFTEAAVKRIVSTCNVCVQSGPPLSNRKVSIKHIDKDFNQTLFVDVFYFEHGVPLKTHMFLHVRCAGLDTLRYPS